MKILIVGAAGMVGRKLAERLARDGALNGRPIAGADLVDIVAPAIPAGASFPATTSAADIADPAVAARLVASRPDMIFHLAAIVSGEAEQYCVPFNGRVRWTRGGL